MYENELYHYGVKGMKWGVRRYQKKDGSLTRSGEKRVAKAGVLYFPSHEMKRGKLKYPVKNRLAVSDADKDYAETYANERKRILNDRKLLKKSGYNFTKNPDSDVREHNNGIVTKLLMESPTVKIADGKRMAKFIDKYADATISDLGLKNTEKTKAFVKDYLTNNSNIAVNTFRRAEEAKNSIPKMSEQEKGA